MLLLNCTLHLHPAPCFMTWAAVQAVPSTVHEPGFAQVNPVGDAGQPQAAPQGGSKPAEVCTLVPAVR